MTQMATEPIDLAEVKARINRHRCNAPRHGDEGFLDLSRLIDHDAPALVDEVERLRAAWDRLNDMRIDASNNAYALRQFLETALTLVARGEDPRANRTWRRFEHETRTFLAGLDKPGEETP
jgi:hypothetical protein